MRPVRVLAGTVVAFIVAVALSVGVVPTAAVAATATMNDYRQTLPASVLDTIPVEERSRWIDGTRAGSVGTGGNVYPLRSTPGPRSGMIGGAGTALLVGGQMYAESHAGTDGAWWRDPGCNPLALDLGSCLDQSKPENIDQEEWDKCKFGGDDPLGTLQDWTQWLIAAGTDCKSVREGWEQKPASDWEWSEDPVGAPPPAATGYPFAQLVNTTISVYSNFTVQAGQPYWVTELDDRGHQIGWVYPMNVQWHATPGKNGGQTIYGRAYNDSGGALGSEQSLVFVQYPNTSVDPSIQHRTDACGSYAICLAPNKTAVGRNSHYGTGAHPWGWSITRMTYSYYPNTSFPGVLPWRIDGAGAPPKPGEAQLEEVSLVTTITTESGKTVTCRTEGFVESASWVPQPCMPTWADPDEIITERIVEVVPTREIDTWKPYSDPSREVERTTVPQPVRDQQRENSECSTSTCYVEVMVQREDGVWVACSQYPELCRDWYKKTQTAPTSHPYRCEYNGKVVNLAECRNLARIFEPGAIESGTAYPDPDNQTNPGAAPGGQTSTNPSPTTKPGQGVNDPERGWKCFEKGWSMNPVDWVVTPIKCALQELFVPRPSWVNGQLATVKTMADGKLPMVLLSTMQAWEFAPTVSGCDGFLVPFSNVWHQLPDHRILNACSGPLAPVATVSSIAIGISAVIGTVISVTRSVGNVVEFGGIGGK